MHSIEIWQGRCVGNALPASPRADIQLSNGKGWRGASRSKKRVTKECCGVCCDRSRIINGHEPPGDPHILGAIEQETPPFIGIYGRLTA